ncbi:putative nuclease HARBI1 [Aricia agestis]|uniref:putative nuclease HARBI1 n=1 Tax=Aricia agestis TaxID=91739 RepID=UPI001C206635|nr:putative nuclease HARBI1 [Aricia agestis]
MAARVLCILYLLEEAKRRDELEKRRQSRRIRNLRQISSHRDYVLNFRLTRDLISALEGDLVPLLPPRVRRGGLSHHIKINDCDLNILHVDATFGGATHDSFIFNNTVIQHHLEQINNAGETAYLLGDSAYGQRSYLMTPCANPEPGSPEEYYNTVHSTARNSVERTIGILKGRFRCLLVHRVLHYDPEMVSKIVIACCVLHNICNRAGLPAFELPYNLQHEEIRLQSESHHSSRRACCILNEISSKVN